MQRLFAASRRRLSEATDPFARRPDSSDCCAWPSTPARPTVIPIVIDNHAVLGRHVICRCRPPSGTVALEG